MARQKEGVSRANPCQICGRTDGDFRLIDEDGFVTHWCFRGPDRSISGFVHTGQHQSKIALYQIYQSDADYRGKKALEKERWLAEKDRENPNWRKEWAREQELKNPNWRKNYSQKKKDEPSVAVVRPLEERKVYTEHPDLNRVADVGRRNEVNRNFLSLLKVENKHLNKLRSEWGDKTIERIQKWGIRSLPPIDFHRFKSGETYISLSRKSIMEQLVKRVGPPEYVPGFYEVKGNWTFTGLSGIVYPLYDLNGNIPYLRIANDYPDVKGDYKGKEGTFGHQWQQGKHIWSFTDSETRETVVVTDVKLKPEGIPYGKTTNKYLNFNSCKEVRDEENLIIFNERSKGARAGSHPGFYASKGNSYRIIDATEGEKKSIVNNEVTGHPTICLPGVGTWAMLFDPKEGIDGKSWFDILVERGMKQLNIMYDADKYENERVMNAQEDFIKELSKYPQILVCVGEWSTAWGKKGLDDILLAGIMPRYIPIQQLKQ